MELKKENCKRKELRDVKVCIRVTKSMSKFMRNNELSPSQVMVEALKSLGYKGE